MKHDPDSLLSQTFNSEYQYCIISIKYNIDIFIKTKMSIIYIYIKYNYILK